MRSLIFIVILVLMLAACQPSPPLDTPQKAEQGIVQAEDTEHDVSELPVDSADANSKLFGPTQHDTTSSMVTYHNEVQGYLAQPSKEGDYPGVVMIHEWWGLNEHIKEMADNLAAQGYRVLAVDLYHGNVAETSDRARELVGSVDQEEAVANMQSAKDYLDNLVGDQKIASLGWCFGGKQSLQLSLAEHLDATVIYYGNLETNATTLSKLNGPVLGIFGAEDSSIPVEAVSAFESGLEAAGVEHSVHVYEGVGHAFANPSGSRFAAEETKDAWDKTTRFLAESLK